ncbi:stalk domain-containing protein [Paenibacillus sp. BC26]|uniref:stalk domain-containing protein n=1 Tax=Paenibacillus sp. BC26 TaxID=1881032 RepID=UPI0008E379BD|nr:stalk domain-containing protein [Paenibacillus sp. BC26]SFS47938.1 Trypsin-like peptidase domain-containing protein [Paenibacillus sp. BC26]
MSLTMKLKQKWLLSVLSAGLVLAPFSMNVNVNTAEAATSFATSSTAGSAANPAAYAAAAAKSTQTTSVLVDGKKLAISPSPLALKGTTFVPMRAIFTALKASVTWEPTTKTIIAVKGRTTISLQLGNKKAIKNGKTILLSQAPQQLNGATMVPLRFIAEALGADVQFDQAKHVIRITSAEAIEQKLEADEQAAQEKHPVLMTTKQIVAKNDDKVVMIMTDTAQGSGVVIGKDEILTNYHVIADATKGSALLLNGTELEIQGVVGYNENYDLAIVKTKTALKVDPVDIGVGASKGDHVVAIGSPLGLQNTISDGVISNITFDGAQYYQISVPIDHGSSGGGLFNDYGELIGITAAGIDTTQADLNFAVSSMNILMLKYDLEETPPKTIEFLPPTLPKTLVGESTDTIKKLIKDEFAELQTTGGTTELGQVDVKRDAQGWLVVTAVIDPAIYMQFGHASSEDLRTWALNTGYELRRMLPDDTIQLLVYYDQEFSFEPRGFAPDEVTALGNGKWRVKFPVISYQGKDKVFVSVRA